MNVNVNRIAKSTGNSMIHCAHFDVPMSLHHSIAALQVKRTSCVGGIFGSPLHCEINSGLMRVHMSTVGFKLKAVQIFGAVLLVLQINSIRIVRIKFHSFYDKNSRFYATFHVQIVESEL